jgi:23S rRNA (uracil1939-C5)-methyltransferase
MKEGEELNLSIESAAFEGKSVARVDGMVVFVAGGVPGDTVYARVTRLKKTFAEAEILRIAVPSPLRATPKCRHFGICGGCRWQHVEYGAQLEFKRQHVVDALERIGGFRGIGVGATLGSERIYHYRNKMEFSFGDRWFLRDEWEAVREGVPEAGEERFALGLHIAGRFDKVLDIEECWLQSEASASIVNAIRSFCKENHIPAYSTHTHSGYLRNVVIRSSERTGELMVNLVTFDERPEVLDALQTKLPEEFPSITTLVNNITARKSQVAIGETERVCFGPGYITEHIGKRAYRISANSFFQTNTSQAERMYDTVRRMARLSPEDLVFDLYSGTGTIALHIADDVHQVIGIESVSSSVEDARRNAAFNGVRNCSFLLGDLKDTLMSATQALPDQRAPCVVIVDPPRAGMHEKVVRQLRQLRSRRVVYVSCNPSTQARDLKILCADGLYTIEEVLPVDMFPHTFHIESVVAIQRSSLAL